MLLQENKSTTGDAARQEVIIFQQHILKCFAPLVPQQFATIMIFIY